MYVILWVCMYEGINNICDLDIWEGIFKVVEGYLVEVRFFKVKEEEMVVVVNW